MNLLHTVLLSFLLVSSALAQDAQAVQPSGVGVLMRMMPMFLMVFFIFWMMVLRPQEKKLKAQQELLQNVKKGDEIVTDGGIIGRVAGDGKDYILLDIGSNAKIRVEKTHISKRYKVSEDGAKS